ncbi:MAG: TIGR03905 family TSCPD domain-containing protein [Clostridiales bacterium]|jgi:uncharacterized protein (TIGR03905 family)|nr:TIGR03905 family TSCPD domain-containing protein [Clostridiales bacterium]
MYTYKTNGVCSREITFDIVNGTVKNISFDKGCEGNLKGIAVLADGLPVADVIKKLENITCEGKRTSCPAQLAIALKESL